MLEFVFIIVLVAVLVMLVMQWRRGRGGGLSQAAAAQYVQGTLTVTGVSNRPGEAAADKNGESYCTVSGTITGPQTAPTEVYATTVIGALGQWPHVGADMPVMYKPGKAESTWRFGTLEQPPGL